MFLNQLSAQSQNAFLSLSYYAAESDGLIVSEECGMLQEYCREMEIKSFTEQDLLTKDAAYQSLRQASETEKKIVILELLALLYVDEEFDEKEQTFVTETAFQIGLSKEDVTNLAKHLVLYMDAMKGIMDELGL